MKQDLTVIIPRPLDHYLEAIRDRRPFCFSRWGDGEWTAVLERRTGAFNCDQHPYTQDMGRRLQAVLQGRPDYWLGLQPLAVRLFAESINAYLRRIGWDAADWHDADVFHRASARGLIGQILRAIGDCPVVAVGPLYLGPLLMRVLNVKGFVEVPQRNCWARYQRILDETLAALEHLPHALVSISCSMPAEILVDDIHQRFPDRHCVVDFGSFWDPYAGRNTRKYHRDVDPGKHGLPGYLESRDGKEP